MVDIDTALIATDILLMDEPVTMQYSLDTGTADEPLQEGAERPELESITLQCSVDDKSGKSYPRGSGFQADYDYELLFTSRTFKRRGFDVFNPETLSRLGKSYFVVRGHLCSCHKSPSLSGYLGRSRGNVFVTFYVKKIQRTQKGLARR